MYSTIRLTKNPNFKMTGEEFNVIVNTMKEECVEGARPIKLALAIRTTHTNLVALSNKSIVCTSPIFSEGTMGYFNVTTTVKRVVEHLFPHITFEDIKNTVLLPIGVYEQNGQLFVYMNLIIQDDQVNTFSGDDFKYVPIQDLHSNFDLDINSLMVLPTLNLVK